MSDAIDTVVKATCELYAALAKAQAEIGSAAKDSKNPHFNSKYADLASVWDAWQTVGPKNGLAVLQLVHDAGEGRQGIKLETILTHSGGGSIGSTAFFPSAKGDAQGYGSALTYARRYMLGALVGVCPDDDDGNAASGKAPPPAQDEGYILKASAAFKKYYGDKGKLTLLFNDLSKNGVTSLASEVEARIKELP